jgi:SAM-dependent methyltransferase
MVSAHSSLPERSLGRKLVSSLRGRGVRASFRSLRSYLRRELRKYREGAFDRRYGTETHQRIDLSELPSLDGKLQPAHADWSYEAIDDKRFRRLMRRVPADPAALNFIDVGAGKGRAIMLAAQYPFHRVIGVEFAAELVRLARQNTEIFATKVAPLAPIELVLADFLAYTPPAHDAVFFLKNPFPHRIAREVIARIEELARAHMREAFIVYTEPPVETAAMMAERFELIEQTAAHTIAHVVA